MTQFTRSKNQRLTCSLSFARPILPAVLSSHSYVGCKMSPKLRRFIVYAEEKWKRGRDAHETDPVLGGTNSEAGN